jgi:hypothetical protein
MIRIILLIIGAFILTHNLIAQTNKTIIFKDKIKKQYFEYEVLSDSKKMKNGDYREYYYPFFGLPMFAKYVKIEGQYNKDLRTGIWTLYSKSGQKHIQVDYDKYKIVYKSHEIKAEEDKNNLNYVDVDLSYGRKDPQSPSFETGLEYFYEYIAKNISRDICPDDTSEIRVYVKFLINDDSSLDKIEISESAGEIYDNEALRLIKNSEGMWIPGNNEKKQRLEVGVIFKNYK